MSNEVAFQPHCGYVLKRRDAVSAILGRVIE